MNAIFSPTFAQLFMAEVHGKAQYGRQADVISILIDALVVRCRLQLSRNFTYLLTLALVGVSGIS
jgi:hypothetical protein